MSVPPSDHRAIGKNCRKRSLRALLRSCPNYSLNARPCDLAGLPLQEIHAKKLLRPVSVESNYIKGIRENIQAEIIGTGFWCILHNSYILERKGIILVIIQASI